MVRVILDDRDVMAGLSRLSGRRLRIGATWALNDTAKEALDSVKARMPTVFDRPTPFALNAFTIRGARPDRLEAEVVERPSAGRRHFLKVEEGGGGRPRTALETLLGTHFADGGAIRSVLPGADAKLNAYGNWDAGERGRVLSALRGPRDAAANGGGSRKGKRRRVTYFVPKQGQLSPGVWRSNADGSLNKILSFSTRVPVYQQRLGFFDEVGRVWRERFPGHLRRAIEKMLKKS